MCDVAPPMKEGTLALSRPTKASGVRRAKNVANDTGRNERKGSLSLVCVCVMAMSQGTMMERVRRGVVVVVVVVEEWNENNNERMGNATTR
jgi:hypothetical protein